jgi:hypothetical protein
MDTSTAPAGTELVNLGEDEQNPDAVPLLGRPGSST